MERLHSTVFLRLLFLALSLFLELFPVVNCKAHEQCLQKESSTLLQLKRGFITGELETWQPGTDCCFWVGVTCDESRRVTGLDLSDRSIAVLTIMEKGQIMSIKSFWTIIKSIDISNNNFEGDIPISIGQLVSLQVLNLSQNHLMGKVLPQLGNLLQLESLDLSMNNLSGQIPQELVSLHFLSFLNLSFNKLVGEIPSGGQFSTFQSTSFEGNKGLCWHPCNTSVPAMNNKVPSLGGTTSENKSNKIVLGLLIGVGLGGSMAAFIVVDVMCCDRSRRRRNIRHTHE